MIVKLIRYTNDPVMAIEEAASKCYDSTPSNDGKIMRHCIRSGHTSVAEHVSFTWEIDGVSRALLAQLTRHRIGAAFSVRSQRYCNEKDFGYVMPPHVAKNPDATKLFVKAMREARESYGELIGAGCEPEDARMVLPNACCTTLTCTMNLRELIHFCNERLCSRAQWEIREMCWQMVDETNKATGNAFAEFLVPKCEVNGKFPYCPESKRQTCGKHPLLAEVYQSSTDRGERK